MSSAIFGLGFVTALHHSSYYYYYFLNYYYSSCCCCCYCCCCVCCCCCCCAAVVCCSCTTLEQLNSRKSTAYASNTKAQKALCWAQFLSMHTLAKKGFVLSCYPGANHDLWPMLCILGSLNLGWNNFWCRRRCDTLWLAKIHVDGGKGKGQRADAQANHSDIQWTIQEDTFQHRLTEHLLRGLLPTTDRCPPSLPSVPLSWIYQTAIIIVSTSSHRNPILAGNKYDFFGLS